MAKKPTKKEPPMIGIPMMKGGMMPMKGKGTKKGPMKKGGKGC